MKKKRIIILISFLCLLSLGYFLYDSHDMHVLTKQMTQRLFSENIVNHKNADMYLNISTCYEDDQPTHPKVISFDQPWNGYRYWMAYTPYLFGKDYYENPCIVVSQDMIHWNTIQGYENPLEPVPDQYIKAKIYNSDTHLIYNSDTHQMECWWRYVDDTQDKVIIYRKVTEDGVHWSDKEVIFEEVRSQKDFLSLSLIYENQMYHLWYIDKNNTMKYCSGKDAHQFNTPRKINIEYENPQLRSWHFDVIHTDHGYEMIMSAFIKGKKHLTMNLYYASSQDNIHYDTFKKILGPSQGNQFDNSGIYRSSFIYKNGCYYVFYSGISKDDHRHIGLAYGEDIFDLQGLRKEDISNFLKKAK